MEFYVPEEIAQEIISISRSINIAAQIVGRVETAEKKQMTIRSEFGKFV